MGAVFRPKDLPSGSNKIIENAVRDFIPDVKDDVVKMLDSWERTGTGSMGSEEKLKDILGQDRATWFLKKIKSSSISI
jgi:hypothetical protein